MKLTFSQQHKSIKNLPEFKLPAFSVITGANGSGKTHLLEAIQNGNVSVDDLSRSEGEIKYFTWSNFTATLNENASPNQVYQQREQAIQQAIQQQSQARKDLTNFFVSNKIQGDPKIADPLWLAAASQDEIEEIFLMCTRRGKILDENAVNSFAENFIRTREKRSGDYLQNLQQFGDLRTIIERKVFELGLSPLMLSESVLRDSFPLTWNPTNTLQLEFANWFSAWQAAYEYNKINKYYNVQEGDTSRYFLEENDFFQKYGDAPWDIANEIMNSADFRYQFNRPTNKIGNLEQQFQLRLQDPVDGTTIQASELSSGEKILLAVTLLLYQTSGDLNLSKLPKLLLLDEVDAPLHPSFTKSLLDILNQKFALELNVSIIMATHSPSTVALAPEGSVFELTREPRMLRPCTVSSATQVLSSGFVSVTPTDTIVITESSADPDYYQPIYRKLVAKGVLNQNPPLTFISASARDGDGEGGGCDQVRNWAPKLHDLGLERFKGLIDKDGANQADDIVKVLNRYSIENYLFDPLTLTAYLIHRGIPDPFAVSAGELIQIRDFINADTATVMHFVRELCAWLASKISIPEIASSSNVPCDYVGFDSIEIPEWWLNTRGHDVETSIREPLNTLGNHTGRGALLRAGNRDELIRFQSSTYPELISKDFVLIFDGLRKESSSAS
jgi:predicted ATPase